MYALTRSTQADEVDRMVAEVGIPPCPAVLAKLIRETRADEPDFARIGTLVGSDAGLSAAMLRVANSALYNANGATLDSVRQAVLRIGLKNTAQLVTGLLLRQAFPADSNCNLDQFWASSSRIASISAHIATQVGPGSSVAERELAFTFSLFRDCGTALMLRRYADYPRLVAASEKLGRRLTDLEQARYGFSHTQVGFEMARSWLLNEVLCAAVLHHHSRDAIRGRRSDLPPASMRLIAIAVLAEYVYLVESCEARDQEIATAVEFAVMQFGLARSALDGFARDAEQIA